MARKIEVQIVGNSASLERSFHRSAASARGFERDIGHAGRGIAAVSLGFAGLGRSLAFASTAFVGAAGLAVGFKEAVSGAESLAKAQASVRTALQHTGEDVGKLLPAYNATAKAAAEFGVSQADALGGLAKATVLTGNAAAAARAYQEALVISKATGKDFTSTLTATAKGQEGITTSLRRYGILVDSTTSGQKQFTQVMQRFGGQARANTSDLDRLRANAENLGIQLGGPLLKGLEAVARTISDDIIPKISRFFTEVGQAHTFSAKVRVVISGLEQVAGALTTAIGAAVGRIDWDRVWSQARGIADGLQKRFEEINWGGVGAAIGSGIVKGVAAAGAAFKEIAARLQTAVESINLEQLGIKLGPLLAAAIVSAFATITDPSFWLHHWTLALAVAVTVFSDGLGKIAGKFLGPVARLFGRVGESAAVGIASGFERFSGRLASLVLDALLKLPVIAERALRPFVATVARVFGRLGGITRFTLKVLGVDAAINLIRHAISRLSQLIGHGLDAAWRHMEEAALKAALAIVEPFSHLPGFLGGGPFQRMKAALQQKLNEMENSAKVAGAAIGTAMEDAASQAAAAADAIKIADTTASQVEHHHNLIQDAQVAVQKTKRGTDKSTQLPTRGGNAPTQAAAATVAQGFTLPFRLQLAQARASATKTLTDDLQVAREIRAFILKQIPHLHGQKLIDAYNQLGQINQEIAGDVKTAAGAGKKAAQKGRDFAVPAALQLADARAQALGLDDASILEKMKRAAQKALRSGKLSIQGQINAWNEIASINQQLSNTTSQAVNQFRQINIGKVIKSIAGLTKAQQQQLRAILSQIGPGGSVPGKGVGAFGFVIGSDDRPIVVKMDGKKVGESTTRHQQKKRRRSSTQRRGPQASIQVA